MRRFSTLSLFLLTLCLLVAVFGVGLGNAQDDDDDDDDTTTTARRLSIVPIPDTSTESSIEETTTTTTSSEDDLPTLTSESETSTSTTTTEVAPPTVTTTSELITKKPPTNTRKPPVIETSIAQPEPSITSEDDAPKITSKRLTTTVVTISGTTIQKTVAAPEPTGDDSKPTEAPGLNPGDKDGDSDSGLDDSQKNIIIGVVVGVGGAILLGGLAVVAWRVWGRKKNDGYGDDDEDMMNAGTAVGSAGRDKASSPNNAGSSPFKSTLDQYHNPGPVNAASNF